MTGIKPRPGVVDSTPVVPLSTRTMEAKRPMPRVSSDGFDDNTDARRQRLARSTTDGFVPVPREKPASIAPPEPIVIPSVSDAVDDLKREAEKPLNGPTDWTVDPPAPEQTEVEIKIAQEIEATTGKKVKVKIDAETGLTVIDNPDGDPATRTIRRTTNDGVGIDAGVANVSVNEGTVYEVRISAPAGTNLDSINPDDPSTWPPGTKVTKHRTTSESWSAGATVGNKVGTVGGELERYDEAGTTETVEKTKDGKIRVTKGPTSASDDSGMVKASLLGIGVKSTSREETKTQELQTVEFDVATPEGRAAYEEYQRTGELPEERVTTTRRVETDLTDTSVFQVAGYDIVDIKDYARGTASTVTTRPDGTSTQVDEATFGEAPNDGALVVTTERDAAGNPIGSPKKEIRFTVEGDNVEAVNQRIKALNDADGGNRPYVKAGDSVTLPADAQTRELLRRQPGSAETLNRLERTGAYGKEAQWEARGANPELIKEARRLGYTDDEIDALLKTDGTGDPQRDARQLGTPLSGDDDVYGTKKAMLAAVLAVARATGLPIDQVLGMVRKNGASADHYNEIAADPSKAGVR